jgi:hypothetical protein
MVTVGPWELGFTNATNPEDLKLMGWVVGFHHHDMRADQATRESDKLHLSERLPRPETLAAQGAT